MSRQIDRLSQGGAVDRSRPLNFTFDGKPMTGYAGDTLASALLANGVKLVGRSFNTTGRAAFIRPARRSLAPWWSCARVPAASRTPRPP